MWPWINLLSQRKADPHLVVHGYPVQQWMNRQKLRVPRFCLDADLDAVTLAELVVWPQHIMSESDSAWYTILSPATLNYRGIVSTHTFFLLSSTCKKYPTVHERQRAAIYYYFMPLLSHCLLSLTCNGCSISIFRTCNLALTVRPPTVYTVALTRASARWWAGSQRQVPAA